MRVLLINNYFSNTGGADIYTYTIGNLLRENGHEVYFFATNKKPYFEENYRFSNYFPENVDYKLLSKFDLIKHNFRPFYNFEAEQKLNSFINLIKPDIVHCNCIFFNLTPSILNACYKNNLPVVMTLHGPQLMCPSVKMMYKSQTYCKNEHCVSGNPVHCITNKCLNNSLIKSTGITVEYLFRKIHKLYDKISAYICPSEAILELALKSGIKKEQLYLNNNFVDDSKFTIQPVYENKGYFLYAGRLSKEKGCHYLLEAMSKLDTNIKLHIVGTGDEEKKLMHQAKTLNLANVDFKGFKSGKELEEEYKNCIATVLPCNWFENLPTSIIESFVYGKPVIGSRIGGIPEMLENNKNGITFEAGNVEDLALALNTMFTNNALVVSLGKHAREKAETTYRSNLYYSKLMKVYNLLTSKNIKAKPVLEKVKSTIN